MLGPSNLWVNVTPAKPVQEPLPPRCSDARDRVDERQEKQVAGEERELFLIVLLRALSAWHT
jgi:hypothetical protein